MKELKNKLREEVRAEIDALPDSYITESDMGIYFNVTSMPEFGLAQCVMFYYSVGREPDTLRLAQVALRMGKTVAFPFCYSGGEMEARVVTTLEELKPAMLDIPAPQNASAIITPAELDFIIVPALTYDRKGFRLGYGGGYYDRFLKNTRALTVGFARNRLLKSELPREPHDIAVNRLATEGELI